MREDLDDMKKLISKRLALGFGFLAVLSVLPACGAQSSNTPTSAPAPQPVEVTVNILGNTFDPQELTVPAGSTVTWHNTTATDHGIVCEDAGIDADLRPGQDHPVTFDTPGVYTVNSRTHSSGTNLTVTITVE